MKEQKSIIKWSAGIGGVSLVLAIAIEVSSCALRLDFIINILVGIFASALISFAISTAQYRVGKIQILKELWLNTEVYLSNINYFCFKYFPQNIDINTAIDSFESSSTLLDEINNLSIEYSNIKLILSNIAFYKKESEIKAEINTIAKCIDDAHTDLSKLRMFNKQLQTELGEMNGEKKRELILAINQKNSSIDILIKENKKLQELLNIKTEEVIVCHD